mmetsp:Transcript_4374/g.12243  ORF Transcript_4374/g.12243 Transcript_4374/m.12243 type:complete len:82 (+) Transcript_4374:2158-2403(+)
MHIQFSHFFAGSKEVSFDICGSDSRLDSLSCDPNKTTDFGRGLGKHFILYFAFYLFNASSFYSVSILVIGTICCYLLRSFS